MIQRTNPLLQRPHPTTIGLHRLPIHQADPTSPPLPLRRRKRSGKYKMIPIDQLKVGDSVLFLTSQDNHTLHGHTLRGWVVYWQEALGITITVNAVPGGYRITRSS